MQVDLSAYEVAALGVDRVMEAIQTHKTERYGSWSIVGPSGRRIDHMPWIWFQGLSIAADEAATRSWGRRADASNAERRETALRFGSTR